MRIDITKPEGNTYHALAIAIRLMKDAHRDAADIDALRTAVMGAQSAKEAREAITKATFDCITFFNGHEE